MLGDRQKVRITDINTVYEIRVSYRQTIVEEFANYFIKHFRVTYAYAHVLPRAHLSYKVS